MEKLKVGYVYSPVLIKQCDRIPSIIGRASMVHSLIESCDLLSHVKILGCDTASEDELAGFHSRDYLTCLKESCEDCEDGEEYGLGYDCPPLDNLYELAETLAGGSLSAARALVSGDVQVAVNFCGGWHHGQRDEASGFCYVNDCVLAILELQKRFRRVLYVDLDIHHGDGVENAFAFSRKVLTLSLHKQQEGYFPGTGAVSSVGLGAGRYHACNVPIRDGAKDAVFVKILTRVCGRLMDRWPAEAIVCQCGADGLASDPLGTFNLTEDAYVDSVAYLRSIGLPLLVLGGGGYNPANTSRCFANVLASLAGCPMPNQVPEHDFFDRYGPGFELQVTASLRRDENTDQYIDDLLNQVFRNIDMIPYQDPKQESLATSSGSV